MWPDPQAGSSSVSSSGFRLVGCDCLELRLDFGRLLGRLDVILHLLPERRVRDRSPSTVYPELFWTRYLTIQFGVKSCVAAGMSSLLTTLPMT